MRARDLSIRTKLFSLVIVYAVGFACVLVMMSAKANLEHESNTNIVAMKDLVADVLPPPEYIIEPYLTLLQLSYETDAQKRTGLVKAWAELEKGFAARHTYWQANLEDGALKRGLEVDAAEPAKEFFALADREFIPAAIADDKTKMASLLAGELATIYSRHRAAIDRVVELADSETKKHLADTAATIESRRWALVGIGVGIVAVCMLFGWAVARSISRRVEATVEALTAVAAGDLTSRLVDDSKDDLGKMSTALNDAIASISTMIGEVQGMATELTGVSGELASSANALATGTHDQAASLQKTAASLEEISATVRLSSDHAQTATQHATGSRESAERGGTVVVAANAAMTEIHDASGKIANIIDTIDDIAVQTNILALNAAVEAARAGDQGRGFAVVATHVGMLANRSLEAAKEIKSLILDSTRKVADGKVLVVRSGETLGDIVKSVTSVATLVGDMAASFREQSIGIEQITSAVSEMDGVMNSTSEQTDRLSSTASRLTSNANHLREVLSHFQIQKQPAAAAAARPVEVRAGKATLAEAALRHAVPAVAKRTRMATGSVPKIQVDHWADLD